jgi:hypothetical protein
VLLTHEIFIPSLSLAFEYQGEGHYHSLSVYGSHSNRLKVDLKKQLAASASGITLIQIPFWWDQTPESLCETLRMARPDLPLQQNPHATCIPTTMPESYVNKYDQVYTPCEVVMSSI